MPELEDGCVQPAGGPLLPDSESDSSQSNEDSRKEVPAMLARVGKEAPDFEATAFIEGKGFQPVKLSDYKGKWIVLCFYPGDFTFV